MKKTIATPAYGIEVSTTKPISEETFSSTAAFAVSLLSAMLLGVSMFMLVA